MSDAPAVTDNPAASRFEYPADGHLAELTYRLRAGRLILVHTGTPPELEGHGIGSALVRAAIDPAAREGLVGGPLCPFARAWLEHHPKEASRVTLDLAAT